MPLAARRFLVESFHHVPLGEPARAGRGRCYFPQQADKTAHLAAHIVERFGGNPPSPFAVAEVGQLGQGGVEQGWITPRRSTGSHWSAHLVQAGDRVGSVGGQEGRQGVLSSAPWQAVVSGAVQAAVQEQHVARFHLQCEMSALKAVGLQHFPGAERGWASGAQPIGETDRVGGGNQDAATFGTSQSLGSGFVHRGGSLGARMVRLSYPSTPL